MIITVSIDISPIGGYTFAKEVIGMKIVALVILSCSIPSVCSAHSGAVVNAVASYLPFIAPFAAGGLAGVVKFIRTFFKKDK